MEFDPPGSYERVYLSFEPMEHTLKDRGITDLQLAKKVGVKVDVIRNMYKYQDIVSLSLIEKICNALDCGLEDLIVSGRVTVIPAKDKATDAHMPCAGL